MGRFYLVVGRHSAHAPCYAHKRIGARTNSLCGVRAYHTHTRAYKMVRLGPRLAVVVFAVLISVGCACVSCVAALAVLIHCQPIDLFIGLTYLLRASRSAI